MDSIRLLTIFAGGIVAGSYATLVGGGALLIIPLLIFLGFSPHSAVATNRLGALGGMMTGWYKFHQKSMMDYKVGFAVAGPVVVGAALGANLVLEVDAAVLKKVIAILTLFILAIVMLRPQVGIEKRKHSLKSHEYIIGAVVGFAIGIYHGFYGAGGTFLSYLFILFFGQTFVESAATRKIAASLSSVMALIVFAVSGAISYGSGVVLFVGQSIGSYIAAHYSDRIGSVRIKRLFFVIVAFMATKLLT